MDARERARRDIRQMLEQLKELLQENPKKKLTESDTRYNFVDPLISALGFAGLDEISREFYIKNSKDFIDYVLSMGKTPVLAIEAKHLQHDLSSTDAAQLLQYVLIQEIEWCALTNGRRLQLFNLYLKGGLEGKLVADFDLLAFNSDKEFDALFDDLWLLSKESWAEPTGIKGWMDQRRVDTAIRAILSTSGSDSIAALRNELHKVSVDVSAEAIVQWFRSRLLTAAAAIPSSEGKQVSLAPLPSHPVVLTGVKHTDPSVSQTQYWLFPASSVKGGHRDGSDMSAEESLQLWLKHSMWGLKETTAGRKKVRAGDRVCFYATGMGVIAFARVIGSADHPVSHDEWPEHHTPNASTYKLPLADIQWATTPVEITREVRLRLKAFSSRDLDKPWSWYVQSGSKMEPEDFATISDIADLKRVSV